MLFFHKIEKPRCPPTPRRPTSLFSTPYIVFFFSPSQNLCTNDLPYYWFLGSGCHHFLGTRNLHLFLHHCLLLSCMRVVHSVWWWSFHVYLSWLVNASFLGLHYVRKYHILLLVTTSLKLSLSQKKKTLEIKKKKPECTWIFGDFVKYLFHKHNKYLAICRELDLEQKALSTDDISPLVRD